MLSATLYTTMALLATIATAAPAASANPAAELQKRGGQHEAVVYDNTGCTGSSIGDVRDFGCGGTCYSPGRDIWSVLLTQATTGNPKPTADFYSGSNCDGNKVTHSGIFKGEHSGCSTMPSPARSYYLYFNC